MSIYEQPMNVYWSGQKSPTSNKYKINYKGTVATASDLPAIGNKKGDTYNISEDGSDYIWTGTEWDKFGANVYIGATSTTNGIQGLVPPATTAQMYSLLTGMGTWQSTEDLGLALDDEVVHKADNENITGIKTFTNEIDCNKAGTFIRVKNPNLTKGTYPTSDTNFYFPWCDKNGNKFSVFETIVRNQGEILTKMYAFKNASNSNDSTALEINYPVSGAPYASCPSTPDPTTANLSLRRYNNSGSTDILTRDWIPRDTRIVHTTGAEEISGFKAFSSEIRLYCPDIVKGTNPSNRTWFPGLTFCDKNHTNESVLTSFSSSVWDNGDTEITLNAYKNTALSNTYTYFQLKMTSDDNKQIFTDATHLMHDSSFFAIHGTSVGDDDTDATAAICCGRNNVRGASLQLYGRLHSAYAGEFYLRASTKTDNDDTSGIGSDLVGFPNGTLTWTGQNIQTSSDARLKTTLSIVSDEVLDAWGDVNWGEFRYLDAVKEKGENARLHLGVIAQLIKEVFENHGLDACAYGILCHEEREATDEEPAFDMWMVRYAEASAMEACYQRRENARLKARLASLEERLARFEAGDPE